MTMVGIRPALRAMLIEARRLACLRGRVHLDPDCRMTEYGTAGYDTFFGYHDVSPFGRGDHLILATRRSKAAGPRAAGTPLELGFFDQTCSQPRFEQIAISKAWCWQQGCRLQWHGGTDDQCMLFNATEQGRHISRVFDVAAARQVVDFPRALYAVSSDGMCGVSLNFARLQRLRPGYGYDDIPDTSAGECAPADDGLWLVDLKRGTDELILSLAQVASTLPEPSMVGATHYFNHVLWSPDGGRFFFMHLWRMANGRRKSRAYIWDMDSLTFSLLCSCDQVSHHCWIDNQRMIIYSNEPDSGTHYHIYDVRNGCLAIVGARALSKDGHPSMSPTDPTLMVTDTYPDRFGEQSLLIFDTAHERLRRIALLYSPSRLRGEIRCDLHPRWSRSGQYLSIDSAHRDERRLCVLNVSDIVQSLRGGAQYS